MRILWICPYLPYPPDIGFRTRVYNLLRPTSQRHEIDLFSLIQSPEESKHFVKIEPFFRRFWAISPESQILGNFDQKRTAMDALLGIFIKQPRYFYGSPSRNVISTLDTIFKKSELDCVIVESLFMSNYVWNYLPHLKVPTILVEHNIETLIQQQQWQNIQGLFQKLRKWLYFASFKNFERQASKLFDYIITVSELDRKGLKKNLPDIDIRRIVVIPNGVDTKLCSPDMNSYDSDTLIYNGSITYDANFDAVKLFLDKIFPLIQQKRPAVQFYITGSTKGIDISKLSADRHVIFTGYLDDIHPLIKRSWASVVPLRLGGGTRLKILEALALGTPVVSTSKGVEGLDLIPGQELLVADTPERFADAVVKLLSSRELREKLSRNGRLKVENIYDWSKISEKFNSFLSSIVKI